MATLEGVPDDQPHGAALNKAICAALDAADPAQGVRRVWARERLDEAVEAARRVWIIGAGKAAARMAQAVEALCGDRLAGGIVVVKDGHAAPTRRVTVLQASHPEPDARGVEAARQIEALARPLGADELVFVLLSGGGSSLLCAPADGLDLEDVRALNALLISSGLPIEAINAARVWADRLKGGGLAAALRPARVVGLILSDVLDSPLSVVASGPLHAPPLPARAVLDSLQRAGLADRLPGALLARLRDAPLPRGGALIPPCHSVGDYRVALDAARDTLERCGYAVDLVTDPVCDEAREVGRALARCAFDLSGDTDHALRCWIAAGEPVVTLGARFGTGGRAREVIASAALSLSRTPLDGASALIAALGTDGTDGPTDVAGAWCAQPGVSRWSLDALAQALDAHDTHGLLDTLGASLRTGPTRTNVNDLLLVLVSTRRSGP